MALPTAFCAFRIPISLQFRSALNEFRKYLQSWTLNCWQRGIWNSLDSLLPLSQICYASRPLPPQLFPWDVNVFVRIGGTTTATRTTRRMSCLSESSHRHFSDHECPWPAPFPSLSLSLLLSLPFCQHSWLAISLTWPQGGKRESGKMCWLFDNFICRWNLHVCGARWLICVASAVVLF